MRPQDYTGLARETAPPSSSVLCGVNIINEAIERTHRLTGIGCARFHGRTADEAA
jgi:hypothetical protein